MVILVGEITLFVFLLREEGSQKFAVTCTVQIVFFFSYPHLILFF
jgi:hypothetical protein